MPNAKRGAPRTGSMPIIETSSPSTVIINAAASERPARPLTRQSPSSISAKNSGGPNLSASLASGAAMSASAIDATSPPMNDPIAAMPSAVPPRPCLAIWWPSRQVITDAASPGTLMRTDVIVPPYIAP